MDTNSMKRCNMYNDEFHLVGTSSIKFLIWYSFSPISICFFRNVRLTLTTLFNKFDYISNVINLFCTVLCITLCGCIYFHIRSTSPSLFGVLLDITASTHHMFMSIFEMTTKIGCITRSFQVPITYLTSFFVTSFIEIVPNLALKFIGWHCEFLKKYDTISNRRREVKYKIIKILIHKYNIGKIIKKW